MVYSFNVSTSDLSVFMSEHAHRPKVGLLPPGASHHTRRRDVEHITSVNKSEVSVGRGEHF